MLITSVDIDRPRAFSVADDMHDVAVILPDFRRAQQFCYDFVKVQAGIYRFCTAGTLSSNPIRVKCRKESFPDDPIYFDLYSEKTLMRVPEWIDKIERKYQAILLYDSRYVDFMMFYEDVNFFPPGYLLEFYRNINSKAPISKANVLDDFFGEFEVASA